jgi:hypothetical protein
MKTWGSAGVLDLGTRWRYVVSFTGWTLYPRHTLDRMLGRPPEPVWKLWNRKKSLASVRNRTPTSKVVAIPIELSRIFFVIRDLS